MSDGETGPLLNTDEFLRQFNAAMLLQGNLNSRLEKINAEEPPFGRLRPERRAWTRWHDRLLKIRDEYKLWGESFIRLVDNAPEAVLELEPDIRVARDNVAATLEKYA